MSPDDTPRKSFGHAVRWAYAARLGHRGIALLLTFILAGMLGPTHFGTIAMAMAYILFIEMLVTQGMTAAIVQRKDLTREHLDSVFWVILGAGLLLAGAGAALSPWWAKLNDLPELGPVTTVLSLSIPINTLTIVHTALRQRAMDFRTLALLNGGSAIIGGAAGIAMALAGCGVWSLVGQQLLRSIVWSSLLWRLGNWRPRPRCSLRRLRDLVGVSSGMLVSRLGEYASSQSDAVLMGLLFGPTAVGLYRMAERLMSTLLDIAARSLQAVSVPHFSHLQDDPAALRSALLSCLRVSTGLTIPAMALIAAVSDQLMALLGARWVPAAAVLKIIIIMGIVKAATLFTDPLLLARRRAWTIASLAWGLGLLTAGTLATVGVLTADAATERQITAIALAHTTVFVVFYGSASLFIVRRLCRVSLRHLAGAIAPGLASGLTAGLIAAAIAVTGAPDEWGVVAGLVMIGLPAALGAALVLLLLDPGLRAAAANMLRLPPRADTAGSIAPPASAQPHDG
jgi:O-antigen/teichoic acid export membrane protein